MRYWKMRKAISYILALLLLCSLAACRSTAGSSGGTVSGAPTQDAHSGEASPITTAAAVAATTAESTTTEATSAASAASTAATTTAAATTSVSTTAAPASGAKVLVAVFSATGTTKAVAEMIAAIEDADLYEIVPAEPYSAADLNYNDRNSRSTKEQNDKTVRPAITGDLPDLSGYERVYLGYPIWWGEEPRILDTFVESCDFTGITVIPFCTSISSGMGRSGQNLAENAGSGTWLEGRRFPGGVSETELESWIDSMREEFMEPLQNTAPEDSASGGELMLFIGNQAVTVSWEDTEAVAALRALAEEGPVTIEMSMYGGFEQVGPIGQSLPANDVQTTTEAGDIVLYAGDRIVIFYGSNTWAYTRLGHITDKTASEMAQLLGQGDVTLTLQMS